METAGAAPQLSIFPPEIAEALGVMAQAPDTEQPDLISREKPELDEAREKLVKAKTAAVREAREFWKKAFDKMREDSRFAAGHQWSGGALKHDVLSDEPKDRYTANITLRHIHQRTAGIYGKNPKIIARRKERMLNTVWDGSFKTLQGAMQQMMQFGPAGLVDPNAMAIIQDAENVFQTEQKLDRIGKTLELLFKHEIDEQTVPFKSQMKALVRRTLTAGVGYMKLGYQRTMQRSPEVERQLSDMGSQLALIEQMSADIADGETPTDSAEAERLRVAMNALTSQPEIIVREGLSLSYPDSTALIPDRNCKQLRGFVGSDWVAEEYMLTADQIKQIYKKDVTKGGAAYLEKDTGSGHFERDIELMRDGTSAAPNNSKFCVWEVFDKAEGVVYVICDGYCDFLCEPSAPDVWLERFWPWFVLVFNEVYDDGMIFPPSDVRLIRDMQLEINRAGQSLREHRRAARPKTVTAKGMLEEADKDAIRDAQANEIIELNALQPNQKVDDVLQPWKGPAIDPALYDKNPAFEDMLRVSGTQEANLGGTSNATATESSIAESSRSSQSSSTVDDLDEFLTEFARAAGQVLLRETSVETVREVCGPGAVWPDLTRAQVAKEIYLDVEAASTGRPNKAAEVQAAQQLMPFLLQIPGLNPEWLARELIRRMDDRLDLTDAFAAGMPPIQAMSRMAGQPSGAPPDKQPGNQGDKGGNNAPSTQPAQVNTAARPPGVLAPGAGGGPVSPGMPVH